MNYCSHARLAVNAAEEFPDDDLASPERTAPSSGDKVTPDSEFDAFVNLVEGVLLTIDDLKSAEGRAAIEFVDHAIEESRGRLGVFSPAAWRFAFRRRHCARAGARVVTRRAGHARARRVASGCRPAASGGGSDGGAGSSDPDPDGLRAIANRFSEVAHGLHVIGQYNDDVDYLYGQARDLWRRADAIERVRVAMTEVRLAVRARAEAVDGALSGDGCLAVGAAR